MSIVRGGGKHVGFRAAVHGCYRAAGGGTVGKFEDFSRSRFVVSEVPVHETPNDWVREANPQLKSEQKPDRKRVRQIERELHRKEKALAEAGGEHASERLLCRGAEPAVVVRQAWPSHRLWPCHSKRASGNGRLIEKA